MVMQPMIMSGGQFYPCYGVMYGGYNVVVCCGSYK